MLKEEDGNPSRYAQRNGAGLLICGHHFTTTKFTLEMEAPKNRITLEKITSVKLNEVFVFGSNQSGRHGKGAAKTALGFGAKWGQAEGLQGRSYGIPTKNASISRTLSVVEIKPYVDRFIAFAKEHPELTFFVTEIGTGLAGLAHKEIAPLFEEAISLENVHLPAKFWHKL